MDPDSTEGKQMYRKILDIEKEIKRIWFKDLRDKGEDVPHVMGRSKLQTSKQFFEDQERMDKEQELANNRPINLFEE